MINSLITTKKDDKNLQHDNSTIYKSSIRYKATNAILNTTKFSGIVKVSIGMWYRYKFH